MGVDEPLSSMSRSASRLQDRRVATTGLSGRGKAPPRRVNGVWDSKTVLRVRRQHEEELRRSRNLRNILTLMRSNVYQGGPLRCIPELIQNAQDEGADEVRFVLEKDAILSYNNGRPFRDYQVKDICSIAQSHKGEGEIGWMGLGFKSVFTVSDNPHVTSGRFNFFFEDLILPRPTSKIASSKWLPTFSPEGGAWFSLPLKDKRRRTREEILKGWKKISPNILLFLPAIRRVEFVDAVRGTKWEMTKKLEADGTVVVARSDSRPVTRWRISEKAFESKARQVGHKTHTPSIRLAFPLDPSHECAHEPLYCYLPTGSPSGLNFLVHADFELSISREALLDDEFNKSLLRSAGSVAADAVTQLALDPTFSDDLYHFIPLGGEIQHPQVQLLESSMLTALRTKEFVRTQNGMLARPGRAAVASDRIRGVVSEADLRKLYRRRLSIVDQRLETGRARQVLLRVGAREVTALDVTRLLLEHHAERRREPRWFLNCYDVLHEEWASRGARDFIEPEWLTQLKERPCVLTTARLLVPPTGLREGEIVSYPAGQGATELEKTFRREGLYIVHRELWPISPGRSDEGADWRELDAKRQRVKDFLCDGLGVGRQADVLTVVEEIILPRLEAGETLPWNETLRLTNYVRRNVVGYEARVLRGRAGSRQDPLERIRFRIRIKSYTYVGRRRIVQWRTPDGLYLGRKYTGTNELEELLKGIDGAAFVADDYLEAVDASEFKGRGRSRTRIPSWPEFFEALRVPTKLQVDQVQIEGLASDDPAFDWLDWPSDFPNYYRYEPWRHRLVDWRSEHLSRLLAKLGTLSLRNAAARGRILWKHLDSHWMDAYSKALHAEYSHFYSIWRGPVRQRTSTFREQLRSAAWVTVAGERRLFRPAVDHLYHPRNRPLLGDTVRYTELECRREFAEGVGIRYRVSPADIIERLLVIKREGSASWDSHLALVAGLYNQLMQLDRPPELISAFKAQRLILAKSGDQLGWFSPDECLWTDRDSKLGNLFGYLSTTYVPSFWPFFEEMGVEQDADLGLAIRAIAELRRRWQTSELRQRDPEAFAQVFTRILLFMGELLPFVPNEWLNDLARSASEIRVLTTSHRFVRPRIAFLADFPEAQEVFGSRISYLNIRCAPSAIERVARWVGVRSLLDDTELRLIDPDCTPANPGSVLRFRFLMEVLRRVLTFKFPELLTNVTYADRLEALERIEPSEAERITVAFLLKAGPRELQQHRERRAFIDLNSLRIWTKPGRLLSGDTALEIARLFGPKGDQIRLLARSILETDFDDQRLESLLRDEAVPVTEVPVLQATVRHVPPSDAGLVTEYPQPEAEKGVSETEARVTGEKPGTTEPKVLIDPEDFFPASKRSPVTVGHPAPKTMRRGAPGSGRESGRSARPRPQGRMALNTFDKERAAINLAMQVEEIEGRSPRDVHDAPNLGCDILSAAPDGREVEIEVKMAGAGEPFVIQPSQWERAKVKGKDYYVYVVSGLLEGEEPSVYAIEDPANALAPAPPSRIEIQKWDPKAAAQYTFQRRKKQGRAQFAQETKGASVTDPLVGGG